MDFPKSAVKAVLTDEFGVGAVLKNAPRVEHDNMVGVGERGKAVGDHEGGALAMALAESLQDGGLGLRIDRAEGIIEQKHGCLPEERAGQSDALPLSSGRG